MIIVRLEDPDGKTHEWEWTGFPSLAEARLIKAHTQMNVGQFTDAIPKGDPDAITALLLILYRRSGIAVAFDEIDCDLEKLLFVQPDDEDAADGAEPEGKAPASSTGPGETTKAD
jgi:hypothetical protein